MLQMHGQIDGCICCAGMGRSELTVNRKVGASARPRWPARVGLPAAATLCSGDMLSLCLRWRSDALRGQECAAAPAWQGNPPAMSSFELIVKVNLFGTYSVCSKCAAVS